MTLTRDFGPAANVLIVRLDTVDSTNAEALRRAGTGVRGPLWIAAKQQTAGRGRRGRPWLSAPGNLHATLLLTDPSPPATAPQLGFVAGLALHDAAAHAAPALAASLTLKWPNDLLCKRRKIAGILIEGEGDPLAVAIGIGVNCRNHPATTEHPATDFAANAAAVAAEGLLDALAAAMRAAGREMGELELVGGTRAVFPDSHSVADLGAALASIPEQMAQGFSTFCLKPSQFTDDAGALGALLREVIARVGAL